ncbi:response regulator transcription factor [Coraliomargarita algicola]|uniref:Response regulator transcription factor n=1 Tax=Coraliomargarita algicola TaxID=3092156 RepID=A0ABZ0RMJ4_9BACT|nr:response regulator transcription factor [Coraliomargarita sp. J2-16]WPJ95990.1 response regulator transcription factor [Coraliomargarita sp. J2-16]
MTTPNPLNETTTVWIIEDSSDYAEHLANLLNLEEGLNCEQSFGSYDEARSFLKNSMVPDVILLDLNLPGMHGLEAIVDLKQNYPEILIVVLTIAGKRRSVFDAMRAGAVGYLLKTEPFEVIVKQIHEVIEGGMPLSSAVTPYVVELLKSAPDRVSNLDLTKREVEILNNLANGLQRKEIADQLSIATVTVDYHLRSIYRKFGVHSTPAAVAKAFREGILK